MSGVQRRFGLTRDLCNLAAFFLSVLFALPADGDVIVAKLGKNVVLPCGLQGDGLEWHHQNSMLVRLNEKTGMQTKGLDRFRSSPSLLPELRHG